MALSNLDRMIQLAADTFATKSDPDQLDIDQEILQKLRSMHPATVSEFNDENGPVAWILLIPTTVELMNRFLKNEISEKELFYLTPAGIVYDALYLCSALVIDEYRRKGIAKNLAVNAIKNICADFPVKALFAWIFSKEGDWTSETIARLTSLPLYKRIK